MSHKKEKQTEKTNTKKQISQFNSKKKEKRVSYETSYKSELKMANKYT